jgi:hypothetical protein
LAKDALTQWGARSHHTFGSESRQNRKEISHNENPASRADVGGVWKSEYAGRLLPHLRDTGLRANNTTIIFVAVGCALNNRPVGRYRQGRLIWA